MTQNTMWDFLAEFTDRDAGTYTVLVMDEDQVAQPRRYDVDVQRLQWVWGASVGGAALLLLGLLLLTPIPQWLAGTDSTVQQSARLNAVRVAALADSIEVQQQYIQRMQRLLTGRLDSVAGGAPRSPSARPRSPGVSSRAPAPSGEEVQRDHQQPAFSVGGRPVRSSSGASPRPAARALSSLQFPMRPPVDGFPTRSFDVRARHYAVDIAVAVGTPVRAVGDGYVVLADWMQDGGFTLAVQHANGFVSVYKHNEQLLKQVGDRVRSQETVAVSGNSGEITTGPHLHFELWHEGLAQDPQTYVVGW